ncbi:MAG: metallophosphoesterase [Defluviitaleaceae bacterium]|nr:metallophosphoesterase [Defluviitaleaceae bacterium]
MHIIIGLPILVIFAIGVIESFLIFFLLVNSLAFLLHTAKKRPANRKKLLLLTLACGGLGTFFGRVFTKQRLLSPVVLIGLVIAIIPMVHVAHSLTLDRIIRYVEIEFRSPNWPAGLDGYRIAFITDAHVIPHQAMADVAAELTRRNIDLLLLGGDFAMGEGFYQGTIREIAKIATTDGIFGVDGNHDIYHLLFAAMENHSITPLDNSGLHIREGFFLAGVQDMWNRNPNVAAATQGAKDSDFTLLLSHNPDISMQQPTAGIDLILSGHSHAGQITLFGWPMYLLRGSITSYGTRFVSGFAHSADGVPVFTSSGIGVYYNVPRIFARPEVVVFSMFRG